MIEGNLFDHLGVNNNLSYEALHEQLVNQLSLTPEDWEILTHYAYSTPKRGGEFYVQSELDSQQGRQYEARVEFHVHDPRIPQFISQGISEYDESSRRTEFFIVSLDRKQPFVTQKLVMSLKREQSPIVQAVSVMRNYRPEGDTVYADFILRSEHQTRLLEHYSLLHCQPRITFVPRSGKSFITSEGKRTPIPLLDTPLTQGDLGDLGLCIPFPSHDNATRAQLTLAQRNSSSYLRMILAKEIQPGWVGRMFQYQQSPVENRMNMIGIGEN